MYKFETIQRIINENLDSFMKDLKEALLEGSVEDEFWYLLSSYIKLVDNAPQEDIERMDEAVKHIMQSSKYAKYFKDVDHSRSISEFVGIFSKTYINPSKGYEMIIKEEGANSLCSKVLAGEKSKKSGINNDKTRYLGDIEMFDEADASLTEDFLAKIQQMGGEKGVEKALGYGKQLAQTVIENKIEYYNNVVEYLVGFYANIAIAKLEEEEREEKSESKEGEEGVKEEKMELQEEAQEVKEEIEIE